MIRQFCALLLALTLAATSVSAAVMQSEMQGAQQMLICSDSDASSGLSLITLDATGRPITGAHHCADCTAASPVLLPGLIEVAPHSAAITPARPRPSLDRASQAAPPQSARDPPAFA